MDIDWSKAPEGATYFDTAEYRTKSFMKLEDGAWYFWPPMSSEPSWAYWGEDGFDYDTGPFVARPTDSKWNGEGLPPVGTVCEVLNSEIPSSEWERCTILYSGKHRVMYDSESCSERVGFIEDLMFRPIRTPEQIAAEERLKAIDEMAAVYKSNYEGHVKDGCQALYDAGYRLVKP